jgi:serine protease AprX
MTKEGGTLVNAASLGISWGRMRDRTTSLMAAMVAALILIATPSGIAAASASTHATGQSVSVIVRAVPGATNAVERQVKRAGGHVGRELGIINGFVANVPSGAVAQLQHASGVLQVVNDGRVSFLDTSSSTLLSTSTDDPDTSISPATVGSSYDAGSVRSVTKAIGARKQWAGNGLTGAGIGVALIDTGVVPVQGLTSGNVVNGPDLSFETNSALHSMDGFGHGTFMAGLIAGRDALHPTHRFPATEYAGVAPDSTLVNVKVGASDGSVDVSQIIAAIDWVVQHRNDNGMNIRVLNLSLGTNSLQSYQLDPLAYAAEVAWQKGIVVVAAAGNDGQATNRLADPAIDPYVIAVGSYDLGTGRGLGDNTVATFSQSGNSTRYPDLVAPGVHIQGLRDPGSYLDLNHPEGLVPGAPRLFKGSGTSEAAAITSGAVALLLQGRPNLTPDQVKAMLMQKAVPLTGVDPLIQGAGQLNLRGTLAMTAPNVVQSFTPGTGTGSLEAARGTNHVSLDGINPLVGEISAFGAPWDGATWSGATWSGATWSGGNWSGATWSGATWSGGTWSGATWSGATWSGATWSGATWSGATWSGATWSGATWSGATWSGATWSGATWSGATWSGATWSGATWSGATWSGATWSGATWSGATWSGATWSGATWS